MSRHKRIDVYYRETPVGVLAETADRRVAFEYDRKWLNEGFTISPFSLPLKEGVFLPKQNSPDGMFGVFRDSLPDAWGRLLLDKILRKRGVDITELNMLDRLALVGEGGMGALTYQPEWKIESEYGNETLDEIAEACRSLLVNEETDKIDVLYRLAGSSGGARPKVLVALDGEDWIVKFPSTMDSDDIGLQEYEYASVAEACGIEVPETRLFSSDRCPGYFGSKRFDREKTTDATVIRRHMITVEGMLETDHRFPNLDYRDLMKLTEILSFSDQNQLEEMYRRMCFNVFAHNRDDHSKNFAFLYDEKLGKYRLSPAYDLTYSTTYYGEHTTSVGGEAAAPDIADLIKVGTGAGLSRRCCHTTAERISELALPLLRKWGCG